ncbi:MAG TPA: DUF2975 domain-containing protein [Terriglobales bacterium]|nr:DUF2975 domain-containing protein [Terriglobales bacterium]
MIVRILSFLLWAAVALVIAGTTLGLAAVAQGALAGHAAQTTLPLRIEPASASAVLDRVSGDRVGELVFEHATLKVHAGGIGYAALQGLDIGLTGGLWLFILILTLRLVRQFASGRPFDLVAVRRLRSIAWSMIALNLWTWVRLLALPPVLLSAINPATDGYRILPTIAHGIAGVRNARVDSSLGVGLLAAGLLILVLSEAFRVGAVLREDNEGIV